MIFLLCTNRDISTWLQQVGIGPPLVACLFSCSALQILPKPIDKRRDQQSNPPVRPCHEERQNLSAA